MVLGLKPTLSWTKSLDLLWEIFLTCIVKKKKLGFPGSSGGKESACNVGNQSLIPGLGRSPGEAKGYSLQYCALENSMDLIAHGVSKSRTQLSNFHIHFSFTFIVKFESCIKMI